MAKRKKAAPAAKLVEALKASGDPLSEPAQLRTIRELERKLTLVSDGKRVAEAKLKQAEHDLAHERDRLALLMDTASAVKPAKLAAGARERGGTATAILCCNDWHAEERIDADTIDGANQFDLDIAERRINRTWQKALYLLDFARGISNIKDLIVWLGGDLINGAIHEELEEGNFLGPTEAILWVQDRCATGIDLLLREGKVKSITVVCNYGNHGRTTKKTRIATGYRHSWEWLAYHNLAGYYRNEPRVAFKVEKGYHNWLDIQGYPVRFHHGDSVRYQGGVGGLTIPLNKAIAEWNKRRTATFDVLGHWHQYHDQWNAVCCGCLVGYNAYAVAIKAAYQPPTQTFIVVDRAYGKILATPVFCEEGTARA